MLDHARRRQRCPPDQFLPGGHSQPRSRPCHYEPLLHGFLCPDCARWPQARGEYIKQAGYSRADIESLSGRELGVAVAEAMINFEKSIGFPTTLGEVKGFSNAP
jgi:hypothetical protein